MNESPTLVQSSPEGPAGPRILVWCWPAPEDPSGSPAILAEILGRIPAGMAEVICEGKERPTAVRTLELSHRITKYRGYKILWPFTRGSRFIQWSRFCGIPWMLLYGLYRIWRYKPDVILTIHIDTLWILTSYWLSKLSGVPVVYYVHDPYAEKLEYHGGWSGRFARWLEARSLRHGKTIALYGSLQRLYAAKYDIPCPVVRHFASGPRRIPAVTSDRPASRPRVIGFAGAIYDNNRSLLELLIAEVKRHPDLRLRIYTSAQDQVLRSLGLPHPQIVTAFEADYQRLLAQLGDCDLLYLPLAFGDTPGMPSASLEHVLPTKAIDYLLAGPSILVHCPAGYETSRFFAEHRAGYCLSSAASESLRDWLRAWLQGDLPELTEQDIQHAVENFDSGRNMQLLTHYLRRAAAHLPLGESPDNE